MGLRDPLLEAMAEVKVNGNQLRKQAARAESASRAQEEKAIKALKKGQIQISRIHASSSIREKRRSVTLLQKAAEADVIYADLAAAKSTRDSTRSLAKASRALDVAGRSINLERTLAMANTFVSRSEDFKLAGAALEGVSRDVQLQEGMAGAEGEGAEDEVDRLMERLADNAGVDLRQHLEQSEAPREEIRSPANKTKEDASFEDGLAGRLRALRS
ncbi:hypothetical protein VTO42DRAFT_6921 [Malbranchea cinnamomea]